MASSSSWVLVDDADPRIQYSPGWQAFVNGSEVDGTKHGAASAGLTASFSFTGTQVTVVGSLGSVDVHGIPTSLYTLDGAQAGLYTAPVIEPGFFRLNVTFFASKTLAAGDHTLVVTNVNGTSPNVFWLDYLEYVPSAAASTSPTVVAMSTTVVATTSSSSSSSTAPASTQTSPANSNAPASTSHNRAGAIAGGVIGGVALVLAIALALVFLRRRRRTHARASSDPSVRPFGSWRSPDEAQVVAAAAASPPPPPPSQKQMMHMAGASTPTLSATLASSPPPTASFTTSGPTPAGRSPAPSARPPPPPSLSAGSAATDRVSSREPARSGSQDVQPQVLQTVDSGLRLAGETVVLPPPYTRE